MISRWRYDGRTRTAGEKTLEPSKFAAKMTVGAVALVAVVVSGIVSPLLFVLWLVNDLVAATHARLPSTDCGSVEQKRPNQITIG